MPKKHQLPCRIKNFLTIADLSYNLATLFTTIFPVSGGYEFLWRETKLIPICSNSTFWRQWNKFAIHAKSYSCVTMKFISHVAGLGGSIEFTNTEGLDNVEKGQPTFSLISRFLLFQLIRFSLTEIVEPQNSFYT
ncbi:MAG: hypothetical protein D6732_25105 [Methanobacteriota archaeon]|nr:MAG: hypothetical protein D6732_25105 [Euryarchaeota archaeon]